MEVQYVSSSLFFRKIQFQFSRKRMVIFVVFNFDVYRDFDLNCLEESFGIGIFVF